jgi:hypothetical protein
MKRNYTLLIIAISLAISLGLSKLDYNSVKVISLFNSLITVSGIITAIIIAYAANKIFEERSNRLKREIKIKDLFSKITSFRKIAYYISESDILWPHYDDIIKFKKEYKKMTYSNIHNQHDKTGQSLEFWNSEMPYNSSTIDFYLALKEIVGDSAQVDWSFDPIYEDEYTFIEIEKLYHPSNQLWYYLFHKHVRDIVIDKNIHPLFEEHFYKELKNIDEKYTTIDSIPTLCAEIGSDFESKYLPRVHTLMRKNVESLPLHFKLLIDMLLLIIIFGIVLPLLYYWVENTMVSNFILILSTSFSVTCLIGLFIVLKEFIYKEVHFGKYT